MEQEFFDIENLQTNFKAALKDETDIAMDFYLEGFKELYKFFQLMGSVFGFVSSDVKSKIEVLESHRQKEYAEQFETFSKMLEYEKSSALLDKKDYVSGSRTLLRLHRGLAFVREFLLRLSEIESHEKTTGICKTAYNDTLAQYHPWIIRKGALVAMHVLPTRDQLLNRVCQDAERSIAFLPDVLETSKIVYERTEQLYTDFDLHALP
ncbi:ceramide-1-phosphate transfer protein [Contarinia nasturtii]|uniref:ceramide-1-phosphate transfer protein n=1 Tax=Contarinia nasturtii TaxID=265458 RepID=UPI0012D39265|nr:ceramide-1-phosphate transfer protein [Contarinia nasturtii]